MCKQATQIFSCKLTTGETAVLQGHQSNLSSSGQHSASWEKVNVSSPLITISAAKSGDHQNSQEQKEKSIKKLTTRPVFRLLCIQQSTRDQVSFQESAQRQMLSCSVGSLEKGFVYECQGSGGDLLEQGGIWQRSATLISQQGSGH